jgi:hypothetical protein
MHALKRIASPDELAQAALYLAADASSFQTGTAGRPRPIDYTNLNLEKPLPHVSGFSRRIIGRVLVHRVRRAGTADEDDHRLIAGHCEVRPTRGLGVNRAHG